MSKSRTSPGGPEPHEAEGNQAGPSTPLDFESAVEQIEKIIERIESGESGLEESIAQYERGVGLIRRCRQVLDKAEQRVEELTGQMQEDAARESGRTEARAAEQEPGV